MGQTVISLTSISMRLLVQAGLGSLRSVTSFTCARCGWSISAHKTAGILGSLSIDVTAGRLLNLSRSRHALVLTSDGNVLISCESEPSEHVESADSGPRAGTSYTPASSDDYRGIAENEIDRAGEI